MKQSINKSSSRWLGLLAIIFLVAGLAACVRQDPLINTPPVNSSEISMDDMEFAIFEGCAKRGWSPTKVQDGVVDAKLNIREHEAVVRITFIPGRFTITYVSSEKLNYGKDPKGGELIHPNYNSWVQYLKNDIAVAIAQRARELNRKSR
jgi:hypothetical protein